MKRTTNYADVLRAQLASNPDLNEMVEEAALNARIAHEIYTARTEAGLTQTELAERAGMKQSVIARLEDADYSGRSIRTLQKIGRALGKGLHFSYFAKPTHTNILTITTTSTIESSHNAMQSEEVHYSFVQ